MEQNTMRFGRKIKPLDAKLGDILLIPTTMGLVYTGEMTKKGGNDPDIVGFISDEWYGSVEFFENDKCWLVEELRIEEVDSLRLNQKPFAILDTTNNVYLSKRSPLLRSPSEYDFTLFSSLARDFPSFSAASEYLQKYLTGRCKVVFLKV